MEILSPLVLRTTKRLRSILLRGLTLYLKFVTTDAGEKVVFGKVSESVRGSLIRTLVLADGSITDSGGLFPLEMRTSTTGTLGVEQTTVTY